MLRAMRTRVALVTLTVALAAALVSAQRGRFGDFDRAFNAPLRVADNQAYDGKFAFVRLTYDTLPGGYWYRGQPAWSHGYPTSEENLVQILRELTAVDANARTNTLSLEDPEIFRYPLLYIIEVSWWNITEKEARNLKAFLDKGGFVIVDDFKTAQWRGGRGWDQFADNMRLVDPTAKFYDLDISHPLFSQFFTIKSLDIFPQAYNAGQPIFRALYDNNDPSARMRMFVNYNTDISQFWEWSARGIRPIDDTNEAYKLGVNAIIYGLTH
ncbi:MAG: hypothetical protein AMXMBFR57_18860 [Acidimicrobiia bacterium]